MSRALLQSKSLCTEILIRILARGYDAIMRAYNTYIYVVRMAGAGGSMNWAK